MKVVEDAMRELSRVDELRERAIKLGRLILRSSRKTIIHIHKGEIGEAEEALRSLEELVVSARKLLADGSPHIYSVLKTPLQEYVEAKVLFSLVRGRPLPSHSELGVDPSSYLLGLADSVGELRRHIIDLLREWRVEDAGKYLNVMERIVLSLLPWDLPNALAQGLREKIDLARRLLDSTKILVMEYERAVKAAGGA